MAQRLCRYWIPAAPIQRLMQVWMEENARERNEGGHESRAAHLAQLLWPNSQPRSRERRLRCVLTQPNMDFDAADRILCAMDMVHAWITDPELSEIYWNLDLSQLDHARPTSPRVREELRKRVQGVFDRIGSVDGTTRELGLSKETIRRYLTGVRSAGEHALARNREQARAA